MKIRFRFTKLGKVRWTSHRDVARMWERAVRRIELPLAYTAGFSPRPKMSFGLALPTGHESLGEYLDVEVDPAQAESGLDVASLPDRLSNALPVGITVARAAVLEGRADSLQQEVTSCRWEVEAAGTADARLRELVAKALAAEAILITRERKGQQTTDDVRPAILSARVNGAFLECELATQPRGLRPAEFLRALDDTLEEGRVRRTHQWIERDGARTEPLPADATDAPLVPMLEPVS
jgi:radical SAM-linked protein